MGLVMRIIREFEDGDDVPTSIVYDEAGMRDRLQARMGECLSVGKKLKAIPKVKHTREEIHAALDKALNGLFKEFREETIKLV